MQEENKAQQKEKLNANVYFFFTWIIEYALNNNQDQDFFFFK